MLKNIPNSVSDFKLLNEAVEDFKLVDYKYHLLGKKLPVAE